MAKFTPEQLNRWRIWPRMIITLYGIAFYRTTEWFMSLPDPTNAQAGFVSVIVGAGAGFYGIYQNGKPNPTDYVKTGQVDPSDR